MYRYNNRFYGPDAGHDGGGGGSGAESAGQGGGQQAPQHGAAPDLTALQAEVARLAGELNKAIGENAKYREHLRTLTGGIQQALGIEPPAQEQQQPWEARISALQQQLNTAVEQRIAPLQQQLQEAEKAKRDAEIIALKARIGGQYGLPEQIALRLQGETEEALKQDAEALQKTLPRQVQISPMNPASDPKDAVSSLAENLYNRRRPFGGLTLFDSEVNEAMGGGVQTKP